MNGRLHLTDGHQNFPDPLVLPTYEYPSLIKTVSEKLVLISIMIET